MFILRVFSRFNSESAMRSTSVTRAVDWKDWVKKVRAQSPPLFELGRVPPKVVLSFGGSGFLCSYSLGVAKFLQEERAELLGKSYLLGAGSGVIPAVALACGPQHVSIDALLDALCAQANFSVTNEAKRREVVLGAIERFLPGGASNPSVDVVKAINGRVALTIGFSNKDEGYIQQLKDQVYFGHHVCQWDNRADLTDCLMAAMSPNVNHPYKFRDADNVLRGTFYTMSSELDQHIRHVHVHGYCGYKYNRHQTRHNFHFGKHGFIANTHFYLPKQAALAFMPHLLGARSAADHHRFSYEQGFLDAKRYERWEEDPYFYAKPDRSAADDFNWKSVRASVFGGRKGERFDL